MTYQKELDQIIQKYKAEFVAISDQIWAFAEPRFQETRSSKLQQDFLREKGFSIHSDLAGEKTAFIAEYGQGKPVVAFLGEFDALSGLSQKEDYCKKESNGGDQGHGCGHNLLGTASLAAATALKEYAETHKLSGTIRYYGCPAEENAGGKAYLVRDGFFSDCDIALSWHPANMNMVQPTGYLANFRVFFTFQGISSHAAGSPHLGRSALDAVELMDVGVNYLREHMISEARVHYAITDTGGNAPNVVQSHAQVLYAIRAPQVKDVKELYDRVCSVAKGAAMMTGTTVEIRQVAAYSNYLANDVIGQELEQNLDRLLPMEYTKEEIAYAQSFRDVIPAAEQAEQKKSLEICFGKKKAAEKENQPLMNFLAPIPPISIRNGSTDVGDVSWVVPTGQIDCVCWAAGTAGHSWQATAQGKSSVAHKGMLLAAKVLASTGYSFLTNPSLVEQARENWLEELNGETYPNPLPADAKPGIW